MRKQIARAILVLIAVLGLSSTSWADVIQLGTLVYTQTEAESGIFSITNQTGDNQQDAFPVDDFVPFVGMTLTVNGGLFGTLNGDFNDSNAGHPGYEWDKTFQGLVASAVIGGVAPAGPFNVVFTPGSSGIPAGSYILTGEFFLIGGPLVVQDGFGLGIIAVNARQVVAPEPVTMSLLGLGVAGILVRRRRMASRS